MNRKYPDHPDGADKSPSSTQQKDTSEHDKHVIVASEPTTYKMEEWKVIEKNVFLSVDEHCDLTLTPFDKA